MPAPEKCTTAFIETTVDNEVVIVSLDQGKFFSLKDTGLAIWRKIDGNRSRSQILAELASEFDAPGEVLARDLDMFLQEVIDAGFVRQSD
jgi:photosystem II stability/assembly factor-like uncharacterized protein